MTEIEATKTYFSINHNFSLFCMYLVSGNVKEKKTVSKRTE